MNRTRVIACLALCLLACSGRGFQPAVSPLEARDPGETYIQSINFPNVELRNFIQAMNVYLKENFVLAPGVTGNITVYSARPISLADAESVFYSILNLYGFTAVPSGEVTHIVPLVEARGKNIEVGAGRAPDRLIELGDRLITQIIPLRYTRAETIMPLLSGLISRAGNLAADARTGSLVITDAASSIVKLLRVIDELDQPPAPPEETLHIYQLDNANAQELAQVLQALAAQLSRPTRQGETPVPVSIVAVPATNSLLITAGAEQYRTLELVIRDLDRLPDQVLIEALVVEVTGDLAREFGIQWQYGRIGSEYGVGVGSGGTRSRAELEAIAAGDQAISAGRLLAGVLKGDNLGLILNLYGKDSDFNVLSTPQIVTADNKEALIKVGRTIPVVTGVDFFDVDRDRIREQVEYRDVGITLRITPQISQDRNVRLEVDMEVEDVITAGDRPTTSKRSASSSLVVRDGQTMILGGLMDDKETKTVQGVPGLSRLPVLGHLFRSTGIQKSQTNLYIFITPTVITSREEAEAVTGRRLEDGRLRLERDD